MYLRMEAVILNAEKALETSVERSNRQKNG